MKAAFVAIALAAVLESSALAHATAEVRQASQRSDATSDHRSIDAFNLAFSAAIRSMNNEAVLALWEENGIALLPDTPAVRGKSAIRAMLDNVSKALPHANMTQLDNRCFDIVASGNWASEWCLEHQVVEIPGKPTFDGWGKMLLVLHRQPTAEWRLAREMWNHADPSEQGRTAPQLNH